MRRLELANELALARARSVGAAPAVGKVTIDVDSTVCEVHGSAKGGAAYGHSKVLGYHPLVAVRDDTGELVRSRMRSGNSGRGHGSFIVAPVARTRRIAPRADIPSRSGIPDRLRQVARALRDFAPDEVTVWLRETEGGPPCPAVLDPAAGILVLNAPSLSARAAGSDGEAGSSTPWT